MAIVLALACVGGLDFVKSLSPDLLLLALLVRLGPSIAFRRADVESGYRVRLDRMTVPQPGHDRLAHAVTVRLRLSMVVDKSKESSGVPGNGLGCNMTRTA